MNTGDEAKLLCLASPISRWDEALPLGNGMTGVLMWGGDRLVKLSLDRGDLWDERRGGAERCPDWNRAALREIVAAGDGERLRRLDRVAAAIPATRLPAGRIEIALPAAADRFVLDLSTATGRLWLDDGRLGMECFCAAAGEGIYFRLPPDIPAKVRLVMPAYGSANPEKDSLASLGYPPGCLVETGRRLIGWQPTLGGWGFAVVVDALADGAYRVLIDRHASFDALSAQLEAAAPPVPYPAVRRRHCRWWKAFWQRSSVVLPDREVAKHYHLCRYFYGSGSRPGAPPLPLQGVWTAADGQLPPWKGDYHHDLNTQMTYLAYLTSGDFDCGRAFFDHLSAQLPVYRRFAREFFGCSGIAVPGTATLAGQALGGWGQYSFSPTNSAWLAVMFADHYRYTLDRPFLRRQAWPFLAGVGELLLNLLETAPDGRYRLPLSTSPEIHDNTLAAYLPELSNYDLALLRRLFGDLQFAAAESGRPETARFWAAERKRLPDWAVDDQTGLQLCPGENLLESHRHHSHLMAIYPLRLLAMEHPGEAKLIADSLRYLKTLGERHWVGFSFVWHAAMAAYCGFGEMALFRLQQFLDGFVSRNGFHLNGDYKNLGYCNWKYRPFTLEGNFLAMQTVHEMLLSSAGGVVRIFPALPASWQEVAFENLRGEGGLLVSAGLAGGRCRRLELLAPRNVTVRLADTGHGLADLLERRSGVEKQSGGFRIALSAGVRWRAAAESLKRRKMNEMAVAD
ncbi:hypothetical protein [Victivallis sp. Marseille-Q1083]|uniref:glycosyl hydrolase family 95 catalytic domain-containing protein n=1 Tax=Victivallis sp. Marseille-Q1083 TaxID=2717288 RepID=UPI00158B95DD|nr:hypothetical protein [Victivallis sp. Marseille-Q1083]